MGNLTLNGATSGQITLAPTSVAGTNTLTLPAATGTVALTSSPTFSGTVTATTVTSPAATALTLQSAGTTAITVDTSQNATFAGTVNMSSSFLRNRIINGNMVIDQRNAGASFTATNNSYMVDRYVYYATQASKFTAGQNLNSVTPPAGYSNYLGFQVSSSYSVSSTDYFICDQPIEGYNVFDLAWGTANAKTVTLSFQVYSSLTGTFGGSLQNSAQNRSYPFTYTISSANTWTSINITITGDTIGTWVTNNGVGIRVNFSLGTGSSASGAAGSWAGANYWSATGATSVVGTSGATFYITGVQLEQGSIATPFERPLYSKQLADCERYYQTVATIIRSPAAVQVFQFISFNATMRTAPTVALGSVSYVNGSGGSTQNPSLGGSEISFTASASGGYMGSTLIATAEL